MSPTLRPIQGFLLPWGEGQDEGAIPSLNETRLAASAIVAVSVGVSFEAVFGFLFFGGGGREFRDFQSRLRFFQDRDRVAAFMNEAVDGDGACRIDRLQDGGGAGEIDGDRPGFFQRRRRAGQACVNLGRGAQAGNGRWASLECRREGFRIVKTLFGHE